MASLGPRLARTRGDGRDPVRSRRALDWYLRSYTPLWLERAGLPAQARMLRELAPVADLASADAARAIVDQVLELVQKDAQNASQELAKPLQGINAATAGEAWNEAVNKAEEVFRSEPIGALQAALTEAARAEASALADRAGWNVAVSARDMVVQSLAWRAALPAVAESVAAASRGEPWHYAVEMATEAATAALTPIAEELARNALVLFEQLVDSP